MHKIIFITHVLAVLLFLLQFLFKSILLWTNKQSLLAGTRRALQLPERILGLLILGSGIYLFTQLTEVTPYIVIKLVLVFTGIPLSVVALLRMRKWLAVLALLLFVSAVGMTEASRRQLANGTLGQLEDASGESIYQASCVHCHGKDGALRKMGAADLSTSTLNHDALTAAIRDGKGIMVGYKKILSPKEIDAAAKYVMTLRVENTTGTGEE